MPHQSQSEKPVQPAPTAPIVGPKRTRTRKRPTVAQNGPHGVDLHVGSRVRLARLLAGRTQHWLADRVKLTFQQIQKYERGANRVSCSMLAEFAEALDRPVSWFFEEGTDVPSHPALTPEAMDRQRLTYELVSGFKRIKSEAAKEEIVALARALVEAQERAG